MDDLQARLDLLRKRLSDVKSSLDAKHSRMKELRDLLRYADQYERSKPVHDQLNAIKWKSKREQFKAEHESELMQFYLARRKLADGIRTAEWQRELNSLAHENDAAYAKYLSLIHISSTPSLIFLAIYIALLYINFSIALRYTIRQIKSM